MGNFGRALKDALRYWPILLIATLCSVGTGAIWGFNIGALFPVIEVTVAGESLQDWIDKEIATSQSRIQEIDTQIDDYQIAIAAGDESLQVDLDLLKTKRAAESTGLASSLKLKPYIDNYLPRSPFETVIYVVVGLVLCTFAKHVFQFINTYLVALVAARITRRIQRKVFAKALELDQATFASHSSSGFVAHITHSTGMLSGGIVSVYGGAIREPLKLIACLIGAALICPRLLMLTMVIVPLVGCLIYLVSRSIKKVCHRLLLKATGLHHVMLETFNNIRTVQAYGRESHERQRFDKATMDMQRFGMQMVGFNALNRPLTELLGLGMMGTAMVAGSYLVMYRATDIWGFQITNQPLGAASIMVFFGMLIGASDPLRKLSRVVEGINSGVVAANLIYPVLDQPSQIVDPADPRTISRPHTTITFNDVHFRYDPEHPILAGVSLEIPHGVTVAIVGVNGSGKSSLINLLCRFYDPQAGQVLFDGVDIRELTLKDLRSRIALVTQNTELFNEDIRYNILYGAVESSEELVAQSARDAFADSFIRDDLPDQFDTVIGQAGQRLSGGQRQRIALARAFARKPDILILDEATSQVDAESERLIFEAIRHHCDHQTVLFVTHRQEMIEVADIVLTVNEGDVTVTHRTINDKQSSFSDAA